MSAVVIVDISQVERWAGDLYAHANEVRPAAEIVVAKVAFDIQKSSQVFVPVDTGYLKSSITVDVDGLEAEIGPTADYGSYVEDGTSRMQGQPYMAPAVTKHVPNFEKAMAQIPSRIGRRRG